MDNVLSTVTTILARARLSCQRAQGKGRREEALHQRVPRGPESASAVHGA